MRAGDSTPDDSNLGSINFPLSTVNESDSLTEIEISVSLGVCTLYFDQSSVFFGISLSSGVSCDSALGVQTVVSVCCIDSVCCGALTDEVERLQSFYKLKRKSSKKSQ